MTQYKLAKPSRYAEAGLHSYLVLRQERPPLWSLLLIMLIAVMLGGMIVWSDLVEVSSTARATGKIIPSGKERVVQHLEGGIIQDILVRDGTVVRQGQILLQFDGTIRGAERAQVLARQAALRIREMSLKAFIQGVEPDFGDMGELYPEQVEKAEDALRALRARVAGNIDVLTSQRDQRGKSLEISQKREKELANQLAYLKETVGIRDGLFKKGYGSRLSLLAAELEQSKLRSALGEIRAQAEQTKLAIQEIDNKIEELKLTERDAAQAELGSVLAKMAETQENLQRLTDRVKRLDVRSPVSGVVHGMSVNTPGAVVEPGQVLMTIVPIDEQVVAEVRIEPKDIGHVVDGLPVKMTISGFDARRYGTIEGHLESLSATTFADEKGQPFFKGRVIFDTAGLEEAGRAVHLLPGMTLQADIVTGSQTLLRYLTTPIYVAVEGAFRER